MFTYRTAGRVTTALMTVAATAMMTTPAVAQQADPASTSDRIAISGGVELVNSYSFRGLRQDDTGLIVWPQVELGVTLYSGDQRLKNVSAYIGSWNSLHTGVAGLDGPSGERWYESDIRAGTRVTLRGLAIDASYTAYTSPNDMFTTVKELALRLASNERAALGVTLRPYALLAFELGTADGVGQVDGGSEAGKYLELGAAPAVELGGIRVAFPLKVGLSLGGYYELAGTDHTFGYSSVSGVMTVPLGRRTSAGAWNVHGGIEYQMLGDTATALNSGDQSKAIGSIGVGWSR